MKIKSLIITLILIASLTVANAQTYKNGDITVDGSIGLGYTGIYDNTTVWPTLILGAEKGFYEVKDLGIISVGGLLALTHNSYSLAPAGVRLNYDWTDMLIGARGALHLTSLQIDKVDLYGGLTLGLNFYADPGSTLSRNVGLKAGIFAGGKYYFNDKLSAFGELGWDVAWLKLGICYKLN